MKEGQEAIAVESDSHCFTEGSTVKYLGEYKDFSDEHDGTMIAYRFCDGQNTQYLTESEFKLVE